MQRIVFFLLILFPSVAFAQISIGIKGGLNLANVRSADALSTNNLTGYMIGGYISTKTKKTFGYRSEFILSRQGYNYKTNTNTGNVNLDYLVLPQLFLINLGKRVQVQAGGQIAFLLNAQVDSTNGNESGSLFNYFKRFDYGLAGGVEFFPYKGLFIGGRINISLNNVTFNSSSGGSWPGFIPKVDAKNNLIQVYLGWRFKFLKTVNKVLKTPVVDLR
jgi:Outer membrane protein beta-barrel domain